jgi:hypothetical protein
MAKRLDSLTQEIYDLFRIPREGIETGFRINGAQILNKDGEPTGYEVRQRGQQFDFSNPSGFRIGYFKTGEHRVGLVLCNNKGDLTGYAKGGVTGNDINYIKKRDMVHRK